MCRARETAGIICKHLAPFAVPLLAPDPHLAEGIPAATIPSPWAQRHLAQLYEDSARIELAFRELFYRSDPIAPAWHQGNHDDDGHDDGHDNNDVGDDGHEFHIVVCHGNVIRYMFMRALQLPPEAWLRLSLYNCSLTYLTVNGANGNVSARLLGDVGHLSVAQVSNGMRSGFRW